MINRTFLERVDAVGNSGALLCVGRVFCLIIWLAPPIAGADIAFENVTQRAGIAYSGQTYGASWGDFDSDGWPDIWVSNHTKRPNLYRNQRDGTFRNIINEVWSADPGADTHAAAWADFDNDGDQDLVELVGATITADDICFGCGENHLFVNDGGALHERAKALGVNRPVGLGRTPLWFDADGDGQLDLLVVNQLWEGKAPSTLYRQTAQGFVESNQAFGLADTRGRTKLEKLTDLFQNLVNLRFRMPTEFKASAVHRFAQLVDLSGDGSLDLVLYSSSTKVYSVDTVPFDEITNEIGFPNLTGVIGAAIEDFNGDGLMDMYVTRGPYSASMSDVIQRSPKEIRGTITGVKGPADNRQIKAVTFRASGDIAFNVVYPYWLQPSKIFIGSGGQNPEDRSFTLSTDDPQVRGPLPPKAQNEQGVGIDYDPATHSWTFRNFAKFHVDFFISSATGIENIVPIGFEPFTEEGVDALLIHGKTGFALQQLADEVGRPTACHSVTAGDFDNDMDVDLYLVCARPAANLPNRLFKNDGKGNFSTVPDAGGATGSQFGRGDVAITADYDRDGFLDIFVSNGSDPASALVDDGPHELFRNKGNQNHWIEIDLVGVESNRDGIGATLELEVGGVVQVRGQGGGMHKFAHNHQRLHFGLGQHAKVDGLTITWPSGIVQRLDNIPANQILEIRECQGAKCDYNQTQNEMTGRK